MREGKCPSNWRLAVNLAYSLMCPLGAIVSLGFLVDWHPDFVGYTLAFAGLGVLVYLAR